MRYRFQLLLFLAGVEFVETLGVRAACTGCTNFGAGIDLGTITISQLVEASGIAASRRNAGVLWTHNDGDRQSFYAVGFDGGLLATFDLTQSVDDVEDIAVGPGPVAGQTYLFVGDIGGNAAPNNIRSSVKVLRVPEPLVDRAWAGAPPTMNFSGVEQFTLDYPDSSYDAEALLVDPISGDVFVVTKQEDTARVYRANLAGVPNNSRLTLMFVRSVPFDVASGGDISADGAQIILRREDFARVWQRCDGDTIATALGRTGVSAPILGPPTEENGEGIGFLPDGTGYVTLSEGASPVLHFFQARCAMAPRLTLSTSNVSAYVGGVARFQAVASGFPTPNCAWWFNTMPLAGQTNATLVLSNLTPMQAGSYVLIASNASGRATNACTLVVAPKPDVRITEVQSAPATGSGATVADWWELTSFAPTSVNLTGWRFNDVDGGLSGAFVFSAPLTIAPGESIVFVQGLTATQFRNWWGATNLPAGLQIVTYTGSGFGLENGGDQVRLWDNTTVTTTDFMASAVFGTATTGVTFNYNPVTGQFGGLSVLGVNGVIRASVTTNVGSPGRIQGPLAPPTLLATQSNSTLRIAFQAAAGRRYALEARTNFTSGNWNAAGDTLVATSNGPAWFNQDTTQPGRYFRVRAQ